MKLERFYTPHYTLGWLYVSDGTRFATMEPPWLGNKPNESCIPEGIYTLVPHDGAKYSDTFRLEGRLLDKRTGILFHVGNRVHETDGCILLGLQHSSTEAAIISSQAAMQRFRAYMATHPLDVELVVCQYKPGGM